MCLKYGTPSRFLRALDGEDYPILCEDKQRILALLRDEFRHGYYDDEEKFHPFLRLMLHDLLHNHKRMSTLWREPKYRFCDVMQSVGLVFGFVNTLIQQDGQPLRPTRQIQDGFLGGLVRINGQRLINDQVYTIVRDVALKCCKARDLKPWTDIMNRWLVYSGFDGVRLEHGLRYPGRLVRIGQEPLAQAS